MFLWRISSLLWVSYSGVFLVFSGFFWTNICFSSLFLTSVSDQLMYDGPCVLDLDRILGWLMSTSVFGAWYLILGNTIRRF